MGRGLDAQLSKRLWITRYLMVMGIVILHLPPFQPLRELGDSPFEWIKAFFTHGVFRATVPLLTVISGYLVFSSGLDLKPLRLVQKKTQAILLPLILWNLPLVLLIFAIQKYNLSSHEFSANLYPIDLWQWLDALVGLQAAPANYPLFFLRDLFVLSLLAPLLGLMLRHSPYFGLLAVLGVFYYDLDGPLISRNSMLVSYYIGGLAVFRQWNLTALDRYAKWLLLAFLGLSAAMVVFQMDDRRFFRLIAPLLLWPAMSLVMNHRLGDWIYRNAQFSFFTFLAHGPMLLVFWLGFQKFLPDAPYAVFWLLTPPLTIGLCILLGRLFKHRIPVLASLALGGR